MASSLQSQDEQDAEDRQEEEKGQSTLRDTPGILFCERFVKSLDHAGVTAMQNKQRQMLECLEVSNIKLSHCVSVSEGKYQEVAHVFRDSTRRLVAMKHDVELLHKRIRQLKMKLAKKYPEVVAEYEAKHSVCIADDNKDTHPKVDNDIDSVNKSVNEPNERVCPGRDGDCEEDGKNVGSGPKEDTCVSLEKGRVFDKDSSVSEENSIEEGVARRIPEQDVTTNCSYRTSTTVDDVCDAKLETNAI